jgi:hypothetical protein
MTENSRSSPGIWLLSLSILQCKGSRKEYHSTTAFTINSSLKSYIWFLSKNEGQLNKLFPVLGFGTKLNDRLSHIVIQHYNNQSKNFSTLIGTTRIIATIPSMSGFQCLSYAGSNREICCLGLQPTNVVAKLTVSPGLSPQEEHLVPLPVFPMTHRLGETWWDRQTLAIIYIFILYIYI